MAPQTTYFHKTESHFPPDIKTIHGLVPPKPGLIEQVRQKLSLSLDELLRMEDEGGRPLTTEQAEEIKKLSAAIRELDSLRIPEDAEHVDAINPYPKEK